MCLRLTLNLPPGSLDRSNDCPARFGLDTPHSFVGLDTASALPSRGVGGNLSSSRVLLSILGRLPHGSCSSAAELHLETRAVP